MSKRQTHRCEGRPSNEDRHEEARTKLILGQEPHIEGVVMLEATTTSNGDNEDRLVRGGYGAIALQLPSATKKQWWRCHQSCADTNLGTSTQRQRSPLLSTKASMRLVVNGKVRASTLVPSDRWSHALPHNFKMIYQTTPTIDCLFSCLMMIHES